MVINKENKRIIALLLALNLLLVFIAGGALSAFGADPAKTYQVGEDIIASLSPTGILTLTGSGPTYDYSVDSPAPFYKNAIRITTIVLGGGITSIGDYLFYDLYCVKGEIIIPETVITIGNCAFSGSNIDMAPHFDRVVNKFTQLEMVIPKSEEKKEEQAIIHPIEEPIVDVDIPMTEANAVIDEKSAEIPQDASIDKTIEDVKPDDKTNTEETPSIEPAPPETPPIEPTNPEIPVKPEIPVIPVVPEEPIAPIEPLPPIEPIEPIPPEVPDEVEIKIITEQEIRDEIFYTGQIGVFYAEDNNISFVNACTTAGYSNAKDFAIVREPKSINYAETIKNGKANFDIWVNAENEDSIIYNWQAFIGEEWVSVDNATGTSLSIDAADAMVNSTLYRCEAEYNGEKIYSQSVGVQLLLTEPVITQIEDMTTLTATLPDIVGYTLQLKWQYSDNYSYENYDNNLWVDIEGQNETIYIVEEKKQDRYYRYTLIATKAPIMMFTLAPVQVNAKGTELTPSTPVMLAASISTWNGNYDTYWYIKDKTAMTYTLNKAEELAGLAQIVNGSAYETNELGEVTAIAIAQDSFSGKTINLGVDMILNPGTITLASDGNPLYNGSPYMGGVHRWTPIGIQHDKSFDGSFDGNNYSISGVYVDGSTYQGFFSYLKNSNLSNINIANAYVRGTGDVNGGIVADIYNSSTITNCSFAGSVKGAGYAGGVVGKVEDAAIAKISKCRVDATIRGTNYIAGIAGGGTEINMADCTFSGEVSGTGTVGGLIGNAQNSSVARSTSDGTVNGGIITGGLIGSAMDSTIVDSYFSGSAISTDSNSKVGGIVGICNKRLATKTGMEDCYNTGNIEGGSSVGGIVGESYRAIANCYNTGSIRGRNQSTATGGIAGTIIINDINNCYNSGIVSNGGTEADVGQLVGNLDTANLSYSYFLRTPMNKAVANFEYSLAITGNGAVSPGTLEIDIAAVIENTSMENPYAITGNNKLGDTLNAYVKSTHNIEMSKWELDPSDTNNVIFAAPEVGKETFGANILPGAYYSSIPADSPQVAAITANSKVTLQFTGTYNKTAEDKHEIRATAPIPKGTNILLVDIVDAVPIFYKYKVETDNKTKIYFEEFVTVNATMKNYEERGSSTEMLKGLFLLVLDFEKAANPPTSNELTHMIGKKDAGKLTYTINPQVTFGISIIKNTDKSITVNTTKSGEISADSFYDGKSQVAIFALKDSYDNGLPFALKVGGTVYPSHRGNVIIPMNDKTQIQATLDEASIALNEGTYTLYAELSMTKNAKGPMRDIVTSKVSVPISIDANKKYELGINKGNQLIKPEETSIKVSLLYHIKNADNQTLTLSVEAQKLISPPNNYGGAENWNINDKKIVITDGEASGTLTGVEVGIPQGARGSSASTYRLKFILSSPEKPLVEVYYPIILLPNN